MWEVDTMNRWVGGWVGGLLYLPVLGRLGGWFEARRGRGRRGVGGWEDSCTYLCLDGWEGGLKSSKVVRGEGKVSAEDEACGEVGGWVGG